MKTEQFRWTPECGWDACPTSGLGDKANLVFVFGSTKALKESGCMHDLRTAYPNAHLLGCSTAGEIYGTGVYDDSVAATAVQFEATVVKGAKISMDEVGSSAEAGERLAKMLDPEGLVHVFILSDGLKVNGSELVRGLTNALPQGVTVTGGLSGDGANFHETVVVWDAPAAPHIIAAIGFYGRRLKIGYGSLGGWDSFGPERIITKSKGNILYELDGCPALTLYKRYLGEHAKGLPATGLLFPLSLRIKGAQAGVVRTILSVNDQEGSLTFAGDVPKGSYARLMKANFDRLIDGAIGAATTCHQALGSARADLAVLISCVGRKLILKQRTEEEVEGVRKVLGDRAALTGFYSYGEISPMNPHATCELHNQTMAITTFSEV